MELSVGSLFSGIGGITINDAYKQIGNSVSVSVIKRLAEAVKDVF